MQVSHPRRVVCRVDRGAVVHRTTRWPRTRTVSGIRVAGLERSLADAGRYGDVGPGQLSALTIGVLQQGLTSIERIRAELDGGRLNHTAGVRAGLREFEGGAWSAAEARLRSLLRARRRPFVMNVPLLRVTGQPIGTPDAYLPDSGVAVQVHSKRYHAGIDEAGRDRWSATVEADARYWAAGLTVVGVTPATLRREPGRFLRVLEDAVGARAGMPAPAVVVGVGRGAA